MTARSGKPERLRDAASGVALLSFALALWFYLIPDYASGFGPQTLLDQGVAILLGGFAALLIVLAALGIPTESANAAEADPFLELGVGREPPKLFVFVAIWGIYVATLPYLGFYVGGALAIATSLVFLGMRSPLMLCVWTAGTILAIYLAIVIGFEFPLPHGILLNSLLG